MVGRHDGLEIHDVDSTALRRINSPMQHRWARARESIVLVESVATGDSLLFAGFSTPESATETVGGEPVVMEPVDADAFWAWLETRG